MAKILTIKEYNKLVDEFQRLSYKCGKCGRRTYISPKKEKQLCDWCGTYVFRNKKDEFKYRVKERMK